ncbi:FixH family protein [Ectobacillus antri]|jgi:uncharacterized protein YcfL|uniref:FixH family protein n=1 Tax=Ectobacillus antri TaxID=2486280 RepID=A0ABT6H7T3_9BACI|nr:FixH family protein [Ectobacillus antri]MDG4657358.1 FixH family protein [Ectobacillus antri]MDG5754511.1 FixH family protein [Ectobacillus antri]
MKRVCVALTVMLLAACGTQSKESGMKKQNELVQAHVLVPENVELHKEQQLQIQVKSSKALSSPNVSLKIWNEQQEPMNLPVQYERDGVYSVKTMFHHKGIYYVQATVQGEDFQLMPKKRFAVGTITNQELKQLEEVPQSKKPSSQQGHHR